jgi:hypothetical protein
MIKYIQGEPFELAEGEIWVFKERIDKISNGLSMVHIYCHLVLYHKGLINPLLLEKVAYFLTI